MEQHARISPSKPRIRSRGPGSISSYHAVLRHEDEVGNEGEPPLLPLPPSSPGLRLQRLGLALMVSVLATPFIYLLVPIPSGLLSVTLIAAAAVALGALVGGEIAHRDLTPRVHSIAERQLQHERNTIIATITSLISALEARDPSTRNHSTRVAKLAVRLAKEMGLSRAEQYEVHLGGLLHDVGKIGIPDSILLKPGGLTREEYEVMKSHSILGARMLSGIPGLEAVGRIVLAHHEMFDGNGYPNGVAGEEIPIGARIIAVCDTYMSMTEDRPYRDAQSLERVVAELRRVAGRQLDPKVVTALTQLLSLEVEKFGSPIAGFSASNGTAAERKVA